MWVKSLFMENFRQYEKPLTIQFTRGLNLIEGINNAGKSTIIYALIFALTNKASRFRSPKNLISFNKKWMTVRVVFVGVDGKEYTVSRELDENGKSRHQLSESTDNPPIFDTDEGSKIADIQSYIYKKIGMNKRELDIICYAEQQRFMELVDGKKHELDYIFGITTVNTLIECFQEVIREYDEETEKEEEILSHKKALVNILSDLSERLEKRRTQKSENDEKIKGDIEELTRICENEKKVDNEYSVYKNAKETMTMITELKKDIEKQQNNITKEEEKLGGRNPAEMAKDLEATIRRLEERGEKVEAETEALQNLSKRAGSVKSDIESKQILLGKIVKRIEELEKKRGEALESVEPLKDLKKPTDKTSLQLEHEHRDKMKERDALKDAISRLETKIHDLTTILEESFCNTCERDVVDTKKFNKIIENKRKEKVEKDEQLEKIEVDAKTLDGHIKELGEYLVKKERKDSFEKTLVEVKSEIDEKNNEIADLGKELQTLKLELARYGNLDTELDGKRAEKKRIEAEKKSENKNLNDVRVIVEKIGAARQIVDDKTKQIGEGTKKLDEFGIAPDLDFIGKRYEGLDRERIEVKNAKSSIQMKIKGTQKSNNELLIEIDDLSKRKDEEARSLSIIDEKLLRIEKITKTVADIKNALEVYEGSEEEIRRYYTQLLESKVFEWYQNLAARIEFKRMIIDPAKYELLGVPINGESEVSIANYQGGGQRTLTALAYQLALAEVTEIDDIMMIDEPTDATDTENTETLLEAIHQTAEHFNQIILITHHGIGRERANNVIEIKRDNDGSSYAET